VSVEEEPLALLFITLVAGLIGGLAVVAVPGAPAGAGAGLALAGLAGLAMLFAAAETAVAAVRRARVLQLVEEGSRAARSLQRLLENSTGFAAATRLIITAALVGATTLAAAAFGGPLAVALGSAGWAYAALVAAVLFVALVPVQQVARALGLRHAEGIALGLAGMARAAVVVLWPLVRALEAIGALVYRQPGPGTPWASRDTAGGVTEAGIMLQVDVAEEEGVLEEEEGEMIRSIFEFGDTVAREIMVPRIDVEAAPATMTLGKVVDQAVEAGHSRVPIYEDSIDKILGIFYVKDALRFLREGRLDVAVREVIRPAYFVPETKKVDELLREMQARRVHVAIVVDEYGGTAGLVTIEDILEEIVGEIQDEFDAEEAMVQQLNEHEALVDAMVMLDDLNETLSLALQEEDVDTLGGFVYARLGRVPEQGDEVVADGVRLIVDDVEGNRITKVRVVKLAPPPPGATVPGHPPPTNGAATPGDAGKVA
jgi:CBS domain containing-hemolysin-like protein